MPSLYTHPVAEGRITELKDFAMGCARAFGALITMRDEPLAAEIPAALQPSSHHQEMIDSKQKELTELLLLTPEQAELRAFSRKRQRGARITEKIRTASRSTVLSS